MAESLVRTLRKPWRALRFWQHGAAGTNPDADDELLQGIVETTPECIKVMARDGSLIHMNPAGLKMIEAESIIEVEGKPILAFIAPEDREVWQANHERVCAGAKLSWEFRFLGLRGTRRYMETHAAPIEMPDGTIAQLAITRDITERKREATSEEARQVLASASERVDAMAAAHQALYNADDFETVDGHELIGRVCTTVQETYGNGLKITTETRGMKLPNDSAVPVALLLNELLTNSFKYGRNGRDCVHVLVRLSGEDDTLVLVVQDDGPGFQPQETGRRASGLGLVRALAKQIGGSLAIHREDGATVVLRFKPRNWIDQRA